MTAWDRRETIGDCTLYLGDAMAILPTIEGVELMVSDVPYALSSGGCGRVAASPKRMSGIFAADQYSNDGQLVRATVPFPEMMAAMYAAMATDGDCYVMCNDKNVHALMTAAAEAGFRFHNLLVWDKVSATANRWYMKNCEFCLYLWRGAARTISHPGTTQLYRGGARDLTDHPTEKPIGLMELYVANSSDPGWTVCDPFMGSGTTGVAAARLGRRFIGIECEERHFETACRRIRAAVERPLHDPRAPDVADLFSGGVV